MHLYSTLASYGINYSTWKLNGAPFSNGKYDKLTVQFMSTWYYNKLVDIVLLTTPKEITKITKSSVVSEIWASSLCTQKPTSFQSNEKFFNRTRECQGQTSKYCFYYLHLCYSHLALFTWKMQFSSYKQDS